MKRCPVCDSGAQRVNVGDRVLADVVAIGGGFLYSVIDPRKAGSEMIEIRKNICPKLKYKCTNPACNHEWEENNI